ncbi:MAG: PAS domain S-box protein [Acidobacteriota bacterium]
MTENTLYYRNVLQNMSDGVMTLDGKGRIVMFNEAAVRILGIERDRVLNRSFAEVFFEAFEGNDEFNQAVLDAIDQSGIGVSAVVPFRRSDEKSLYLSVTSSYLKDAEIGTPLGVIVVLSDITEVKQLHEAERRLTQDLQSAYVKIEEANRELTAAAKKMQVVRLFATIFIILMFTGFGLYFWGGKRATSGVAGPADGAPTPRLDGEVRTAPARIGPISSVLALSGKVEPLAIVNVVSPFQGKVKEMRLHFGQEVEKDDLLLLLDPIELEVSFREIKGVFLDALQRYRDLKDWENGPEMAAARRAVVKATADRDRAHERLQEREILLAQGIVSAEDYDAVKSEALNSDLALKAAEDELESVREVADADDLEIARMEFENARVRMEEVEKRIQMKEIRAPVGGVVLQAPRQNDGTEKDVVLELGAPVEEGTVLLAIGSLEGRSIRMRVDEVDVQKLRIGQMVRCKGDGFRGVSLEGRIDQITLPVGVEFGRSLSMSDAPAFFDVKVAIDRMTDEQRQKVRVGMSANLEVLLYQNSKALLVPVAAVKSREGKHTVTVMEKATGQMRDVVVETGMMTPTAVEIRSGLKEGDEVVVNQ